MDELGDLVDVTTLAVALISVGGTLGGTLGGAVLSQRSRRAEIVEQDQRNTRERDQERDERALQAKRELYAQLNAAARAYRVAARDAVHATERGEGVDPAHLNTAKEAWADQYAQAQMALSKDVLQVTSELNRSLGLGYSVVKQLPSLPALNGACQRAKAWFNGPLSDGVYLLRVTLRHDLGVEVDPHFDQTSRQMLGALSQAHNDLARQLAAERRQTAAGTART